MSTRESKPGRHRRKQPEKRLGSLALGTASVAAALVGATLVPSVESSPASASTAFPAAATIYDAGSGAGTTPADGSWEAPEQAVAVRAEQLAVQVEQRRQQARASRARSDRVRAAAADAARAKARRMAEQRARLQWVLPVHGYHLTAGFGDAGGRWSSGHHTGQDFAAPVGTRVYAAFDGKVVFAGWGGAYGNKIEIAHPDGSYTWYAHLSRIEVRSGAVHKGEEIGRVGATGNVTGPHLHFEVHRHGDTAHDAIDPMPWLRTHGLRP